MIPTLNLFSIFFIKMFSLFFKKKKTINGSEINCDKAQMKVAVIVLLLGCGLIDAFSPRFHTTFKNVDIKKGIYHIHSVEHVAQTHLIGAPFFKVHDVLSPEKMNGIPNICFACSVLFSGKMIVRICSKYANRSEMQFQFSNGSKFITIRLTVLPSLKDNGNSHDFFLEVFAPDWIPPIIIQAVFGLSLVISSNEDRLSFSHNKRISFFNTPKIQHNKHFSAYRKMLGLTYRDNASDIMKGLL